jgi:hypothetical protein
MHSFFALLHSFWKNLYRKAVYKEQPLLAFPTNKFSICVLKAFFQNFRKV